LVQWESHILPGWAVVCGRSLSVYLKSGMLPYNHTHSHKYCVYCPENWTLVNQGHLIFMYILCIFIVYYSLFVPKNALWRTWQDGTLRNVMLTARFSWLLTSTLDAPKRVKSIKSIPINQLHFHSNSFVIILHINSLQTFGLHAQPLPRFINRTDFTINRSTVVHNFSIL